MISRAFRAPTAAARRLNCNSLSFAQTRAELSRHLLDRAIVARDESLSRRAVRGSSQSPRAARAPVCKQSHLAIDENFDLTNDAVSTAIFSFPAAFGTQ